MLGIIIFIFFALLAIGIPAVIAHMRGLKVSDQKQNEERSRLAEKPTADEANLAATRYEVSQVLAYINDETLGCFEKLPLQLQQVSDFLDKAEEEFRDGAFAPFWEAIERAATSLGDFNEKVDEIHNNHKIHIRYLSDAQRLNKPHEWLAMWKSLRAETFLPFLEAWKKNQKHREFDLQAPTFPISNQSVEAMRASDMVIKRMGQIVRNAQRNFQFASIYEQRKTNKILVAGFKNLSQAIDGLGNKIEGAIDNLRSDISDLSESLNSQLSTINSSIESVGGKFDELSQTTVGTAANSAQEFQQYRNDFQKHSREMRERHDRALEMLDNLQRERKPRDARFSDHLGALAPTLPSRKEGD